MNTQNEQSTRYGGGKTLFGIPTSNNFISECDKGLTAILQQSLSNKQPIHFMPIDVSDATEYVNGISSYILRIYGRLINGQKARVDIIGIKPFFDVTVPDGESLAIFKSSLVKIVSKTLKGTSKFGIKIIKAYPVHGYHTEKKLYIRITTWNQYDRYDVLKVVCDSVPVEEYKPIDENEYKNPLIAPALFRDKTLVLTWDIETYNSCGTGGLPIAKNEED
ncbi:hypothetical protein Glove_40g158 [Diversispora epigaea]|uniref:DNA-directed DNA polymerase family B exonuclease domain-containing protein n=1 Tax=Diversispora epigaea TaxID=1348612 RepID=A0A397JFR8_9GLOM|nr:hypothetical protein Glove_40g158 [Diversispora epigaea]